MPTWLGIDVGATAVKVAVVRSTYRKTSIVALVGADVAESGGVAEALKKATTEALAGKGSDGVAVSIDGSRAAVRILSLPTSVQKQLGEVLAYELEAQIPFDMAESVFDYRLLPVPKDSTNLSVLAAVARIADVRARIDVVKNAVGLEPERVGVGAFPLANLASVIPALAEPVAAADGTPQAEGPIVVLDLGTKSSEVIILKDGDPVFARTISFGTEGLPATANRLAREIRTTIAAHRSQGGTTPVRLYLCGGGAFVTGGEGFLAAELELPVEIIPVPNVDLAELDPARLTEMPRFAKAIGLAIGLGRSIGLNLRKGPLAWERGFAWVRDKVPLLVGLAAVIVVSFAFSTLSKVHSLSKERETLEAALGEVTQEVLGEETSSAARAQELLAAQTTITDEDPMPHGDAFDVMVRLSEDIPQSMKHDIEELDFQKGHVVLYGIVGTVADAQSIKESLGMERCFQDVKITRTNQQPGGDRQKYVMEFELKCPEDIKGTAKKKKAGAGGDEASAPSAAASASGGK